MSFIETERLILRTWMDSDVAALERLYADEEVSRYLPGGKKTTAQAREWIDRAIEEQDRENFSLWPVVRKDDHRVIGLCGLHRHDDGHVEIGWAFERGAWGQGFGTEAARAVLAYAHSVLKLKDVSAIVDPRNRASVALVNRLGLRFERVLRIGGREVLRYRYKE